MLWRMSAGFLVCANKSPTKNQKIWFSSGREMLQFSFNINLPLHILPHPACKSKIHRFRTQAEFLAGSRNNQLENWPCQMFARCMNLHFITFVFIQLFPNCCLGIEKRKKSEQIILCLWAKSQTCRAEEFSEVKPSIGYINIYNKALCAGRKAEYLGCMDWWHNTSHLLLIADRVTVV